MRVIIAGGTGLIGKSLAINLAAEHHEVYVLSRQPDSVQLPAPIKVIGWDAHSPAGWGELVDGADAIVNLVGENLAPELPFNLRWSAARKHRILQSRILAGQAIVAAVRKAQRKPGVVIQASAVGYYGPRGSELITEDEKPADDFLAQVCQAWEASSQEVETMGVRRVVIRTSLVLSLEGGSFPLQLLPFKLFVGGPIGNGRQGFPWIHIEDEIRAIRFLMANEQARGAFNLSTPNPVTNAELARVLGRVMGRPAIIPIPGFVFKLLFGEASIVLLEGQRTIPQRLQALGFEFEFSHLTGALQDLFSK